MIQALFAQTPVLSDYEQLVYHNFPAVYDAATFADLMRIKAPVLSPDGRRLAARILRAAANACDADFLSVTGSYIPPALALMTSTATYCRWLATGLIRYANLSKGTQSVVLTSTALVALAAFEASQTPFVSTSAFDTDVQATVLLNGVSFQ